MPAKSEEQVERERRKRVEGVAVRKHESTNPHRVLVDDELRHRAARVVADEYNIAQIESSQEVEHDSCDPPRRQVSVRLHRNGMGCQRPRRGERAKATPAQSLG